MSRLGAGRRGPGTHQVVWDDRDAAGRPAANGLYFVPVETREPAAGARFVLMR